MTAATMSIWAGSSASVEAGGIRWWWRDESGQEVGRSHSWQVSRAHAYAFHPTLPVLYSSHDMGSDEAQAGGVLNAHRWEAEGLRWLNGVASQGRSPNDIGISPDGRFAVVSHFMDRAFVGNVGVFPLADDGQVLPIAYRFLPRRTDDPGRAPHPHSVRFIGRGRQLLIADLGLDLVLLYDLADDGTLVEQARCALPAGSGPRQLCDCGMGLWACIHQSSNSLSLLELDAATCHIALMTTIALGDESFPDDASAAGCVKHPCQPWLYTSVRSADQLQQLTIAEGSLSVVGRWQCAGQTPRSLAMDPDGRWLYVGLQDSDRVDRWRIDQVSGALGERETILQVPGVVPLLCVPVQRRLS